MGTNLPVEPPTRSPRVGGLRKVAEFRENTRLGMAETLVYQSDGCVLPSTEKSRCIEAADAVPDKTFDGIENFEGLGAPFTVFAGVACWAGPDPDELERAQSALESGKDRTLEEVYGIWAQAGTALTSVSPGFPGAVAAVDNALDRGYLGRGIILMNRGDAVLAKAAGVLEDAGPDGVLMTVNGTPVLASGMIEAGVVAGTGALVVEHGAVSSYDVIAPIQNKHYALAEQQFALLVDCEFRVAASVA